MKIALMTWFQYHNYGTALQLVAMNHLLSDEGNTVNVVNYHTKPIKVEDNTNQIKKLYNRYLAYKNPKYNNKDREAAFNAFYDDYVVFTDSCDELSELENLNSKYDCFVCGSDQIWSPLSFDSHYFLDYVNDSNKMVAYAPSMSTPSINDPIIRERIGTLVNRFKYISVREKSGAKILSNISEHKNIDVVLDPTFLLGREKWDKIIDDYETGREDYILVYMLGENEKHWMHIKKIAKRLKLNLKIIPVYRKDLEREGCIKTAVGPKEFVKLIKHSKYVLTDSFHGTVFSIIYGVDFNVFERFSNNSKSNQNARIYTLLENAKLENRLIPIYDYNSSIEYDDVYKSLQEYIYKSKTFLSKSLEAVKSVKCEPNTKSHIKNMISLCCGCGACYGVCQVSAISMKRDKEGFFVSCIDEERCISCGACVGVCPLINNNDAVELDEGILFSYKDNRNDVLNKSSSGGAAFAISEMAISSGINVLGCYFDDNIQEATYIEVSEHDELSKLQGSKYMQSRFFDVLPRLIDKKKTLFVFGLPCQIAAARKVHGDNAVYIDLICHGVPTYNLFLKYQDYAIRKYKINGDAMRVVFRDKTKGWRNRFIELSDCNNKVSVSQYSDPYFLSFESTLCYSKSCYECPWRHKSMADVRVGDYWGPKYSNDDSGVSMVLALTEKGKTIVDDLKKVGNVEKTNVLDIIKWQQSENKPEPLLRKKMLEDLSNKDITIEDIVSKYIVPVEKARIKKERTEKILNFIKKIIGYNMGDKRNE